MGQFHISIEGMGIHHNKKTPNDANRLAKEFVDKLKAIGHTVTKASFTSGGSDDLLNVDYSCYDKDSTNG